MIQINSFSPLKPTNPSRPTCNTRLWPSQASDSVYFGAKRKNKDENIVQLNKAAKYFLQYLVEDKMGQPQQVRQDRYDPMKVHFVFAQNNVTITAHFIVAGDLTTIVLSNDDAADEKAPTRIVMQLQDTALNEDPFLQRGRTTQQNLLARAASSSLSQDKLLITAYGRYNHIKFVVSNDESEDPILKTSTPVSSDVTQALQKLAQSMEKIENKVSLLINPGKAAISPVEEEMNPVDPERDTDGLSPQIRDFLLSLQPKKP